MVKLWGGGRRIGSYTRVQAATICACMFTNGGSLVDGGDIGAAFKCYLIHFPLTNDRGEQRVRQGGGLKT